MLSQRARDIKPSPTLAIDSKAKAMKAEGHDVISFGVGEPDFDTPENVKEAAIKAIKDGFTKYTAVGGIDKLKDAIIAKLEKDNGLKYARNEIIVSCGAKHSLYNIMQALLGPGDEVIIPSPYWVSYPEQVSLAGATPVFVRTTEQQGFMLTPEAFEKAVTPKTKALILNSPSNPTGFAYDRPALEKIARIAVRKNIYIISDEIYEKLVYDGTQHISIASLGEDIKAMAIVVNGVSKSHAMTGWRIGYAAGPAQLVKAMTSIQSQSTSNPTSIAQMAAVEALTGPQDSVLKMAAEFDKRRIRLWEGLNSIPGFECRKPNGAFYAFPKTSALYGKSPEISSSSKLAMLLLEKAMVAVVPGDAFGDDDYIRLSYATSMKDIDRGLERIRKTLEPFA
ncbi:MAG: pyridoxal phosphate-dependent aminotransferase [Actinomycetota bacterium]|nr:pyridoxal phosphate-dependent aminotransferase [Actinomycetota bacterium]